MAVSVTLSGKHCSVELPVAPRQASEKHPGSVTRAGWLHFYFSFLFFFNVMNSALERYILRKHLHFLFPSLLLNVRGRHSSRLHAKIRTFHWDTSEFFCQSRPERPHEQRQSEQFLFLLLLLLLNFVVAAWYSLTPAIDRHYSALWQ